jgi:diphthamide synthase (EF-2-diphthine--ammonia ligase)
MPKPKAWMAWSTGKDGAWALHVARERGEVDVTGLLATVTDPYGRVSMHGVREGLLFAQAEAVGLPMHAVRIPAECTDDLYREKMRAAMLDAKAEGVTEVIFGDLFLEGVREYREKNLAEVGMTARFPLWGRDTRELASEMMAGGLGACLTCLDPRVMPRELAGHAFDEELLVRLPEAEPSVVDPEDGF